MTRFKRRLMSLCVIAAMLVTMLPQAALATDTSAPQAAASGSWLDAGNYDTSWYDKDKSEFTLTSAEQLAGFAAIVMGKDGLTKDDFTGKTVNLDPDKTYDLSAHYWTPIVLRGTFDGQGATISGMTIENPQGTSDIGFFASLRGTVQNVNLTDASIAVTDENLAGQTFDCIGGVVGSSEFGSTVRNCAFDGTITTRVLLSPLNKNSNGLGGVVGCANSATVSDCRATGTIDVQYSGNLGGVIGMWKQAAGTTVNCTITKCTSEMAITNTKGGYNVGGVIGEVFGSTEATIENCHNKGTLARPGLSADSGSPVTGGIVGNMYSAGTITGCTNSGDLTEMDYVDYLGGIAGQVKDRTGTMVIEDCHNSGAISAKKDNTCKVGGIVGCMASEAAAPAIVRCSNTGALTAKGGNIFVGGVVGTLENGRTLALSQSYNAGAITISDESGYINAGGGLIGRTYNSALTVDNCYNVGALKDESTGGNVYLGGLLGYSASTNTQQTLSTSYNAGAVNGKIAGGLVGKATRSQLVTTTGCHYLEGCGTGEGSVTVNAMTDDNDWQTTLGLDTAIWEKSANSGLTGYLPVLTNNKQDPAPSVQRAGKLDQDPLSISGGPADKTVMAGSETAANGFTLTAEGGSTTTDVQWKVTKGTDIASIDENGKVTFAADKIGEVVITATKDGDATYNAATASISFYVVSEEISSVTLLSVNAPVQGVESAMVLTVPDAAHYEPMQSAGVGQSTAKGAVAWYNEDGSVFTGSAFEPGKVYKASMRVQAETGYGFADNVTVVLDGINADAYTATAHKDVIFADNLIIDVTFTATDHSHDYATGDKWTADATEHWHACKNAECPQPRIDVARHTDANGDGKCDVCGQVIGYTITFDAAGGSVDTTAAQTDIDGKLATLPTATRSGYTFDGWYTAADGGDKVSEGAVFDKDTTLYAHWQSDNSGGPARYAIKTDATKNGKIAVDATSARKGATVRFTVTPDAGYSIDSVQVVDSKDKTITLTKNADGSYSFTMPKSLVTISATFTKGATPEPSALPFTDVSAGAWYYDPVRFVYSEGLMTGTSATTFSPNLTTTRGMIVAILYRMEGEPDLSNENLGYPFADVDANAYYGDAVYWARMNGIVSGYSSDAFGPTDSITREQLAAILY
ncbi:MAG: S-layer homology domain-containing protein, partial [Peptococcaceae bacterium]|nr:S-layer homology domain-containing protein [Peptococcaceae bacterium]